MPHQPKAAGTTAKVREKVKARVRGSTNLNGSGINNSSAPGSSAPELIPPRKPIERKLDINCDFTRMQALLDAGNMSAVIDWAYDGLADEEWSRSGLGVAPRALQLLPLAARRRLGRT